MPVLNQAAVVTFLARGQPEVFADCLRRECSQEQFEVFGIDGGDHEDGSVAFVAGTGVGGAKPVLRGGSQR